MFESRSGSPNCCTFQSPKFIYYKLTQQKFCLLGEAVKSVVGFFFFSCNLHALILARLPVYPGQGQAQSRCSMNSGWLLGWLVGWLVGREGFSEDHQG